MAATHTANPSRLTLVRQTGMTEQGKPILRRKTFNNIKPSASHQDLYDVAEALSELFSEPIVMIERQDSGILTDL